MSETIIVQQSNDQQPDQDETMWAKQQAAEEARQKTALTLSVLLFVGIYLWGIVWGLKSLSQRSGGAPSVRG